MKTVPVLDKDKLNLEHVIGNMHIEVPNMPSVSTVLLLVTAAIIEILCLSWFSAAARHAQL